MVVSEAQHLLELWALNVCPWCGKTVTDATRVGSGRKSEGGFCSLDCYVKYYAAEIKDRATKVTRTARPQSRS